MPGWRRRGLVGIIGVCVGAAVLWPSIRHRFIVERPQGRDEVPRGQGRELGVLVITMGGPFMRGNVLSAIRGVQRNLPLSSLIQVRVAPLDVPGNIGTDTVLLAELITETRRMARERRIGLVMMQARLGRPVYQALREALGDAVPMLLLNTTELTDSTTEALARLPNTTAAVRGDVLRSAVTNMLRLRPNATTVVAIVHKQLGAIDMNEYFSASLRAIAGDSLRTVVLTDPTRAEMVEVLRNTAGEAVILTNFMDAGQLTRDLDLDAELSDLTHESLVPVFALVTTDFRPYMLGGPMVDPSDMAAMLGTMVGKLLAGIPAADVPPMRMETYRYHYNWDALNRFQIDQSTLPPNAVIHGRFGTLVRVFRYEVSSAVLLIVSLLLGIVLLLQSRRRDRHARRAQELALRLRVDVQEAERQRIARDLHDDLSQNISLMALQLDRAAYGKGPTPSGNGARQLLRQVRAIVDDLAPDFVGDLPFPDLLRMLIANVDRHFGLHVTLAEEDTDQQAWEKLSAFESMTLYRIAQEATQNVLRHANATHCTMHLETSAAGTLSLRICDDGVGVTSMSSPPERVGHGLRNMRERAQTIGWSFTMSSTPGHGMSVCVAQSQMAGAPVGPWERSLRRFIAP